MLTSLFTTNALAFLIFSLFATIARAHTVITYPGWRGDNLHTNGTVYDTDGLGAGGDNSSGLYYPYGMQWQYPCMYLIAPKIMVSLFRQALNSY